MSIYRASPWKTGEVFYWSAVQLRADHSGNDLRRLARRSDEANQTRRLLSLAVNLMAARVEKPPRSGASVFR